MAEHQSTPPRRLTYKEAAEICRTRGWNLEAIHDFVDAWTNCESTAGIEPEAGWQKSITTFSYYGLNGENFRDFIASIEFKGDDLTDENKWRYFCGCAWNTIRVIKDIAENGGIDE